MANMVDVEGLRALKAQHPDAAVVSYVNTTAAVKAESDICCTSSNAVKVVNSLMPRRLFSLLIAIWAVTWLSIPINRSLSGKVIAIPDHLTLEQFEHIKAQYPQALTVVHPSAAPR